jgi:hypothetical protein
MATQADPGNGPLDRTPLTGRLAVTQPRDQGERRRSAAFSRVNPTAAPQMTRDFFVDSGDGTRIAIRDHSGDGPPLVPRWVPRRRAGRVVGRRSGHAGGRCHGRAQHSPSRGRTDRAAPDPDRAHRKGASDVGHTDRSDYHSLTAPVLLLAAREGGLVGARVNYNDVMRWVHAATSVGTRR